MRSPAAREAAADHDELRVEDVHEAADPGAEMAADLREDLERLRVALVREPTRRCASAAGPNTSCASLVGRDTGHVRLEVAAPGAGALARDPS